MLVALPVGRYPPTVVAGFLGFGLIALLNLVKDDLLAECKRTWTARSFVHGGKIVFFGRFIALLRILAALLAGANRMPWPRFAVMNAAGGLGWAATFATAAFFFGDRITAVERPIGIGLMLVAAFGAIAAILVYRRYEKEIEQRAFERLSSPIDPDDGTVPDSRSF